MCVIGFCSILGVGGNMVDNLVKNGMKNEHAYQNSCRNILVPTHNALFFRFWFLEKSYIIPHDLEHDSNAC